jgi:hypothetical protein
MISPITVRLLRNLILVRKIVKVAKPTDRNERKDPAERSTEGYDSLKARMEGPPPAVTRNANMTPGGTDPSPLLDVRLHPRSSRSGGGPEQNIRVALLLPRYFPLFFSGLANEVFSRFHRSFIGLGPLAFTIFATEKAYCA